MRVFQLLCVVEVEPYPIPLIECCASLLKIADECVLSDSQFILSSNEQNATHIFFHVLFRPLENKYVSLLVGCWVVVYRTTK